MNRRHHAARLAGVAALVCCTPFTAFAQLSANALPAAGPLVITRGGTYSGQWASNDPNTAAVTINTDSPVILQNMNLSSRGDLIDINGSAGAQVTIQNVKGTAVDPGVAGAQRGTFVHAATVSSLQVTHCSMYGVSFGVQVLSSTVQSLTLSENLASQMEDRASDGNGGLLSTRPSLGHFIILNRSTAPNGADISWNQVIDTIGQSSVEDVINLYKSQGSAQNPVHIHDNYMEGYSSTTTASYTGTGIIADGDGKAPDTAYALIENNQMVHAAGSGVEIAAGHDINVSANRVVSCGLDSSGHWFAMPFVNAIVVWNYYSDPAFGNLAVGGTAGGMVRPSGSGTPQIADMWARTEDLNGSDQLQANQFTDPCMVDGQVNSNAENNERAVWTNKLSNAGITPGSSF